jgi:hypothetical protein
MADLELRYAHLGYRRTPAREAQRVEFQAHIGEIQAEQERRNAALHRIDHSHIPLLRIAERYAGGIRRKMASSGTRSKGRPAITERWRPKELTDEETLPLDRKARSLYQPRIRESLHRYSQSFDHLHGIAEARTRSEAISATATGSCAWVTRRGNSLDPGSASCRSSIRTPPTATGPCN